MPRRKTSKNLVPLLRGAVNTFIAHPVILFPFVVIAFIQLLVLEILCFASRFPLGGFFNPIVRTLWGEEFTHYPNNFIVLPKLFQYAQMPIYVLISSFLIAVAIASIAAVNDNRTVKFLLVCRKVLAQYVHIFVAALLSFCVFYLFHRLYGLVIQRAWEISSTQGPFFIIKTVVIQATPYVNLLIGVLITAIFAFVFPIIVIEKKSIFPAIGLNFKHLWGSFWYVFLIVLIPTVFYLPALLLRSNIAGIAQTTFPEIRALALVVSVLVTMFIDAAVYTAVTTYYLLKKENL